MTRRRGHGEGTISRRKDGRWVAVVDLGWRDGKRARKFLYGRTRREVAEKLARALRAQQEGLALSSERTTVEQYLSLWLAAVRPSLRPRTWQRYEQLIRLHVIPQAGKLRLGRLAPEHLQQLYAARVQAGLSPTTVLQLHRILHHALGQAARWSLVARNVAELVTPPQKAAHDFAVLSPEQARRFVAAARGDRLEALYVLAVTTGMRQGELLGLRWADVDLERGALFLGRRLKSRSSRRQVLLIETAVEALRDHQNAQEQERRVVGAAWNEQDLVFPNTVGRPINPRNLLRRSFYPLLERAELPRIRFHDLRHSTATLLLGLGVHPKVVSELLGHSQIGITLDLYSHVSATMQRHAVDALAGLFGSQLGSQPAPGSDETAGQRP